MTKAEGHLVSFLAAQDLEEVNPEISGRCFPPDNLTFGTYAHHRSILDEQGIPVYLNPDSDGYEARKEKWAREPKPSTEYENRMKAKAEKIPCYQGLDDFQRQMLIEKMKEHNTRNGIAKQVRSAKTYAEKKAILEEFHREGFCHRKITAVNLDCMKEIRATRKNFALKVARERGQ